MMDFPSDINAQLKEDNMIDIPDNLTIEIPHKGEFIIRQSFVYLLETHPTGELIAIEIGTRHGYYAIEMVKRCDRLTLYTVDSFEPFSKANPSPKGKNATHNEREAEFIFQDTKSRLEPFKNITLLHKTSVEASKDFPDKYFDYVYIDGGHDSVNVIQDLEAWYPKVKSGGLLAGHDFHMAEVRISLFTFCFEKNLGVQGTLPFIKTIGGPSDWYYDWMIPLENNNDLPKLS